MRSKGDNQTLTKSEHQLLLRLVNSSNKQGNKVFDKNDNTFLKTTREIAEITGNSKSTVGRLLKRLKDKDLLRIVKNVHGKQTKMLSPLFMPLTKDIHAKRFKIAMYTLHSHQKACSWSSMCRKDGVLYNLNTFTDTPIIDYETGEVIQCNDVIRKLTQLEIRQWERYRTSYTSLDRTKLRKSFRQAV